MMVWFLYFGFGLIVFSLIIVSIFNSPDDNKGELLLGGLVVSLLWLPFLVALVILMLFSPFYGDDI